MKISKKDREQSSTAKSTSFNKYDEAVDYIRSAMSCLSEEAKAGDEIAKDAIQNLGVVMFDLRHE